ncbi:MAG: DUF4956 domain-containing protein [Clostridia bacterium]|nr:DUF4956 domain-containing protein [Clostridia bacterium]
MENIFDSVIQYGSLTLSSYLLCTGAALVCGIIIALFCSVKAQTTKSLITALILLPAIVHTVITIVNGNIGTGVAVMGAFSLVRFRSVPGKAKDIVAIFLAMAAGLTCAVGYIAIALIFTLIVCIVFVIVNKIPFFEDKGYVINITVPESINIDGAFDGEFKKYTNEYKLLTVKTTDLGSLYRLKYIAQLKNTQNLKEFIDALRLKNGNLEIAVIKAADKNEEL